MEIHLKWLAFAVILNSIGIKNILQLIFLRIFYPKATIKDVESFIKETKIKFTFPKLWK